MSIDALAEALLSANRKGLFRWKPIFKAYANVSADELRDLEREIGMPIPIPLRDWLLAVGYGDIDDVLSFRRAWIETLEKGQLKGGARFAQDELGNFYAFDASGCIYFLSRSEAGFALISKDFLAFTEELVRRDYKLIEWINTLNLEHYEW